MSLRELVGGIDRVVLRAAAHREHRTQPIAGSDEDVLGPRRAVHEVPLAQQALLALDEQQARSREKSSCSVSRWYIEAGSPGFSAPMLIPIWGNGGSPSKRV